MERDSERLEREIQSLLDAGEENGLIDPQSGEMIQSILEFRDTIVREVMIPRTAMVVLKLDTTIDEIIELNRKHGHTRMPVYQDQSGPDRRYSQCKRSAQILVQGRYPRGNSLRDPQTLFCSGNHAYESSAS